MRPRPQTLRPHAGPPYVPKLLVTGHSGFVGRQLLDRVGRGDAGRGYTVVTLPESLDIRTPELARAVAALAPDAVLHLAALSSVADSFRDFDGTMAINFGGTLNLLRALKAANFAGRMLFVGSGDCYGSVPDGELPVSESRPLKPRNPYAVSKVAAEALCYQWSQAEGLDVVIARPFNHIGPGQDERFAVAGFAAQVARIAAQGGAGTIRVGDLDVTRDFTDVRDVVDAYFALLARGRRGEAYNIGSGRETRLRDVLDGLIALSGARVEVVVDETRLRAGEQRRVRADVARIAADTGWAARLPLATSLFDILEFWKGRTGNG